MERLESRDFDRRENALFELAVMLRRAKGPTGGHDPLGAGDLPRGLARVRLTQGEQASFVNRLIRLSVSRPQSRASAFWVLSEAPAANGWEPLMRLLAANGDRLEGEAAYQACVTLRRWLSSGELAKAQVQGGLAAQDMRGLLRRWQGMGDLRLRRAAQGLADALQAAKD